MKSSNHFNAFFFFNDTATTEIYTLSLHDALPIWPSPNTGKPSGSTPGSRRRSGGRPTRTRSRAATTIRSEEHTSELQSPCNLVCRLLLEKKNKERTRNDILAPHTDLRYYAAKIHS